MLADVWTRRRGLHALGDKLANELRRPGTVETEHHRVVDAAQDVVVEDIEVLGNDGDGQLRERHVDGHAAELQL